MASDAIGFQQSFEWGGGRNRVVGAIEAKSDHMTFLTIMHGMTVGTQPLDRPLTKGRHGKDYCCQAASDNPPSASPHTVSLSVKDLNPAVSFIHDTEVSPGIETQFAGEIELILPLAQA